MLIFISGMKNDFSHQKQNLMFYQAVIFIFHFYTFF